MKDGKWEPIARGAADARDRLRTANELLRAIFAEEVTIHADYTWADMTKLKRIQSLISDAMADLTQGLKGRNTTPVKKSSRAMVR
jgi:hypothetical protein